jgi:hypothetical protein
MATSADKDDRDEDEDEKDAAASKDDDEDESSEEEAASAPKPAARRGAARSTPYRAPYAASASSGGARKAPPPRRAALGTSILLFVLIIGGLSAGFAILGREDTTPPKWTVGQVLDLDVTLVPSDARNLTCATAEEIASRHCAFESEGKPWTKGDVTDDKTLLRPYTTTNGIQFFGAGLWSDAGMSPSILPADEARFTARCKYKVEGFIKRGKVRWAPGGPWFEWNDPHAAGTLSDCKVTK